MVDLSKYVGKTCAVRISDNHDEWFTVEVNEVDSCYLLRQIYPYELFFIDHNLSIAYKANGDSCPWNIYCNVKEICELVKLVPPKPTPRLGGGNYYERPTHDLFFFMLNIILVISFVGLIGLILLKN